MRRFVLASAFLLPLPFAAMPLFSVLFSPSEAAPAETVQVIPAPETESRWEASFTDGDDCGQPKLPQVMGSTSIHIQES